MTSPLRLVSEQFPGLRDQVACLFERDELFRELCEDYQSCLEALSREHSSPDVTREYAALRLRLETELLGYLDESALKTHQ